LEACDLDQEPEHPDRDRHRAELAQHVADVAAAAREPGALQPWRVGAAGGRALGVAGYRKPPHGSSMPSVLSNFVCWIALAGSTPLGQTAEHSPTKLQSQIASEPVTVRRRSSPAWSRESRS